MNEKEHLICHPAFEREDFNRKEVGPDQHRLVSSKEVSPAGRVLSFGGGWDAVAMKNVANRLVGELVTQVGQGAHDAIVAPGRVLFCHPHDQFFPFASMLGR